MGAFYFHQNTPPQPDDLVISIIGTDAHLNWSSPIVCQPEGNLQIGYLIFYENDFEEEFGFLTFTTNTSYVDERVARFENAMYYEVETYNGPLALLNSLTSGTKRSEASSLLKIPRSFFISASHGRILVSTLTVEFRGEVKRGAPFGSPY